MDHRATARLLKVARGQIDGVLKMIDEDRYCMDIVTQLLSLEAILKKCRGEVLENHLKSCVKNAKDEEDLNQKIDELITVLHRMD